MKNNYCKLSNKEIQALPERFIGFLLSPFQYNLRGGFVAVPEDTFQEMIDIIAEYAVLVAAQDKAPAQGSADRAALAADSKDSKGGANG